MVTLHRAPWVLPISSPVLADGAVVVDDTQILAVGPYGDLCRGHYDRVVDHGDSLLMPGLVNGHCHLELAEFAELGQRPALSGNMTAWITDLLALRAGKGEGDVDHAVAMSRTLLADQDDQGVALLVDIGNGLAPAVVAPSGMDVRYFTELLGLSRQGTELALQTLASQPQDQCFTCHAPYSSSPVLLETVKKRAVRAGQLFPIHLAESRDEVEFLRSGQGRFRTFLEERQVWDGSFVVPGSGPVSYLAALGLLDALTLCVHCVHLDDDDLNLLVRHQAKVCLCPGSNRFLGVGQAAVDRMLAVGLRPCLGTDSPASNPHPSLWREMTLVAEAHPDMDPAIIVAMATLYGAEAVADCRRGRLAPGADRRFLALAYDGGEPFEFLVRDHCLKEIRWIE